MRLESLWGVLNWVIFWTRTVSFFFTPGPCILHSYCSPTLSYCTCTYLENKFLYLVATPANYESYTIIAQLHGTPTCSTVTRIHLECTYHNNYMQRLKRTGWVRRWLFHGLIVNFDSLERHLGVLVDVIIVVHVKAFLSDCAGLLTRFLTAQAGLLTHFLILLTPDQF